MSGGFLSCRHQARSRIHKISSTRSKIIGDGGGGGGGGPQSVRLLVSILLLKRCLNRQDTITDLCRGERVYTKSFFAAL